jgi:hypothetical protein
MFPVKEPATLGWSREEQRVPIAPDMARYLILSIIFAISLSRSRNFPLTTSLNAANSCRRSFNSPQTYPVADLPEWSDHSATGAFERPAQNATAQQVKGPKLAGKSISLGFRAAAQRAIMVRSCLQLSKSPQLLR